MEDCHLPSQASLTRCPYRSTLPAKNLQRLLDQLDEFKTRFGKGDGARMSKALTALARAPFNDAETLLRFHELLLFVRAYPPSATVLKQTEKILKTFADRVAVLRDADADLSPLEHPEASGIASLSVTDTFSYPIVRWLARLQPSRVQIDWDWFEDENRLAQIWPRFMPLLEDDSAVEANVPYQKWLRLAAGRRGDLSWLVDRIESLPITEKQKTELFDAQKLYVRWTPPYSATRTGMRLRRHEFFYHHGPLIQRRDVSLQQELQAAPPRLTKLSLRQGTDLLGMMRAASTVRYRELYGFTHGDPKRVLHAELGRSIELFVVSLPPGRRLPLRAYHAAMIFKNGVPVGYFEGLSLFERMESGFNFYYGFREGETAWIYARTLNIFHQLLGVTAFAIDPYQVGFENEEGIESGAFWFYRKLGFRPTDRQIAKLTAKEEKKIAAGRGYRTSAPMLRRLAAGSMIWELEQTKLGDWDRFQVRNLGLKVQARMAARFAGDPERIREQSLRDVSRAVNLSLKEWTTDQQRALSDLVLPLAMIPDLKRWARSEKLEVTEILRAKVKGDEARYLKLMQRQQRLRAALIALGAAD